MAHVLLSYDLASLPAKMLCNWHTTQGMNYRWFDDSDIFLPAS